MKILPIKKREGWNLVTISSAWPRLPGSVSDSHLLGVRLGSCGLSSWKLSGLPLISLRKGSFVDAEHLPAPPGQGSFEGAGETGLVGGFFLPTGPVLVCSPALLYRGHICF